MFHERLKKLREQENISREHLANSLGITYSALSKYETGKREPDFKLLQKISNYFSVTTDYLLGNTDEPAQLSQQAKIEKDEAEFHAFASNPTLQKWYKELPKSKEEDLEKLRKMWEILKDHGEI